MLITDETNYHAMHTALTNVHTLLYNKMPKDSQIMSQLEKLKKSLDRFTQADIQIATEQEQIVDLTSEIEISKWRDQIDHIEILKSGNVLAVLKNKDTIELANTVNAYMSYLLSIGLDPEKMMFLNADNDRYIVYKDKQGVYKHKVLVKIS